MASSRTPLVLTENNLEANYGTPTRRHRASSADSQTFVQEVEPDWVWKCKLVSVIIIMLSTIYLTRTGASENWLGYFEEWAGAHQEMASISIILLFLPVSIMFIPVDVPLYLIAGFMYGVKIGFLITYIGYNLGSCFAFFLSKLFFRNWFVEKTRDNLYMKAIRRAIKENALTLVILFQLTPMMPYSMVCFFFGTSECRFRTYALGTAIGVSPMIFIFICVGSGMKSMADAANGDKNVESDTYWTMFWTGVVVSFLIFAIITWGAKKKLDALVEEHARRTSLTVSHHDLTPAPSLVTTVVL